MDAMMAAGPAPIHGSSDDLGVGAVAPRGKGLGSRRHSSAHLPGGAGNGSARIERGSSTRHDPWEVTAIARGIVSSFGGLS